MASGACSTASGAYAQATGAATTASGYKTTATGTNSSAFGHKSCATAAGATAIGCCAVASGADNLVLGGNCVIATYIEVKCDLAPNYAQTSTSGTTSIVDTDVVVGVGEIYDILAIGDPNSAGSSAYRDVSHMTVYITGGYDGAVKKYISVQEWFTRGDAHGSSGVLSFDVVMLNGTTEYTNVSTGTATCLRIKVSNYASNTGAYQKVRIKRVM